MRLAIFAMVLPFLICSNCSHKEKTVELSKLLLAAISRPGGLGKDTESVVVTINGKTPTLNESRPVHWSVKRLNSIVRISNLTPVGNILEDFDIRNYMAGEKIKIQKYRCAYDSLTSSEVSVFLCIINPSNKFYMRYQADYVSTGTRIYLDISKDSTTIALVKNTDPCKD